MRYFPLIVILLVSVSLGADVAPDAPKSPAAIQAQQVHDAAIKRAKDAYQQAVAAADRQYVDGLKTAMKLAAQNGATEEVARIVGVIKGVQTNILKDSELSLRQKIVQQRAYRYKLDSHDERTLEFMDDGTIRPGGGWENTWSIETIGGIDRLVINGENGKSVMNFSDGIFRGKFERSGHNNGYAVMH